MKATKTPAKVRHKKTVKPLAPERVAAILAALRKAYPNVVCALTHKNAFELTIATILSAQTTDVGVNKATPALFKAFPPPKARVPPAAGHRPSAADARPGAGVAQLTKARLGRSLNSSIPQF